MQPKALFFDLDGTLANSMSHLFRWYKERFLEHGIEMQLSQFFQFLELDFKDSLQFLSQYLKNHDPKLFFDQYIQTVHSNYLDFVEPFEHVHLFLEHSKKNGQNHILVTNAQEHIAVGFLKKHKMDHFFDHVVHLEDPKNGKPDPFLYLEALKMVSLEPNEVLTFEDSIPGLNAALNAQIKPILMDSSQLQLDPNMQSKLFKTFKNWQEAHQWQHMRRQK